MSLLGKVIHLKGVTQKGKNRVRELGEQWTVFAETNTVLFSPNQPGPWLFVSPFGRNQDDRASRWVHQNNDTDFVVISGEG